MLLKTEKSPAKSSRPVIGMVSLGCPKATSDSEKVLTSLKSHGYVFSASYHEADLILINTCGFIEDAVKESLGAIDEATSEHSKVVVMGCLGAKKELILESCPNVLAVFSPSQQSEVVEYIHEHFAAQFEQEEIDNHEAELERVSLTPQHYAFLKIAEGCNHHCSFCIIPSLRGRLSSHSLAGNIEEARKLVTSGVKELLVISQDTGAYGSDQKYQTVFLGGRPLKTKLYDLCLALKDFGVWVRLHYLYPYPHLEALLPLMSEGGVLPYFDMPLQHANPRVLGLMRRPAASEKVLDRMSQWRKVLPELVIRSTFITGFPSETETEFKELLDFLSEAQLDHVGAFAYSRIKGADSNRISPLVPQSIAEERQRILLEHQAKISQNKLQQCIGKRYLMLIDEVNHANKLVYGRTYRDSPNIDGRVLIRTTKRLRPGQVVSCEITSCREHDMYARLLA